MNTPGILNPIAAPQGAVQSGRQPDAPAPEVPFHQVLSREVADRSSPAKSDQAAAGEASNAVTSNSTTTKATAKRSDKDKTTDSADTSPPEDSTSASTMASTPADMLALVANLNPLNTGLPTAKAPPGTNTELPGVAARDGKKSLALDAGRTTPRALDDTSTLGTDVDQAASLATDTLQTSITGKSSQGTRAGSTELIGGKIHADTDKDEAPILKKANSSATDSRMAGAIRHADQLDSASRGAEKQAESSAISQLTSATVDKTPEMQGIPTTAAALQHTALNTAQAVGNQPADRLTPRVGTPAWDQALGQKVVWMVTGDQQSASLTLNPPDLGPLQVVLNVSNAQANATFIAAQPEVRQALEAAMPKLREMLGDAGIQLGQAMVSTGTPNQHNSGSGEPSQRSPRTADQSDGSAEPTIRVTRSRTISSGQGMVDTFA